MTRERLSSESYTKPPHRNGCPCLTLAAAAPSLAVALCCLLCACVPTETPPAPVETGDPPAVPSRAASGSPTARVVPMANLPDDATEALVLDVIDGDTITVKLEQAVHTVRYIGINAPERDEPWGPAATEANRNLVDGRVVFLQRDISETDEFDRLLRYVYLPDGTFVNGELVRRGMARARAYPPDTTRQATLTEMEQQARAAGRGLWQTMGGGDQPAGPDVRIVAVDKRAEVVDIANLGLGEEDLTGWTLVSEQGDQVCALSGTLAPGATLRIWALARDAHRGGYNCGFEDPIWNNSQLDRATLYDEDGRLIGTYP